MKNAKDLIIHIKNIKKLNQLELSYAGVKFSIKDSLTAGTLRLMVVGNVPQDATRESKNFPLFTSIEDVAKYIADVTNNIGHPRFKTTGAEVLKDLLL